MNALKPLITELVKLVKKGANLAKDELPVIAHQILKFYLWASILWFFFGVTLILLGVFCNLQLLPHMQAFRDSFSNDVMDSTALWFFGALIGYVSGAIFTISNALDIIKIAVAPRLFLLEYLANFLSNNE